MSVCLESNNVLASQVGTGSNSQIPEQPPIDNAPTASVSTVETNDHQQIIPTKTVTKLLVSNHQTAVVGNVAPVLQKLPNPPVITVLNSTGGPLTVLKTICVTSAVSSAPHFSLVNNQSLNVTNAIGKTPTITLLNAPVTVVKVPSQPQTVDKSSVEVVNSSQNVPTIIENRAHNVFVKNTCTDSSLTDVPQSHKFLTANSFPQTNVITTIPASGVKTINGQRNKMKILSNVVVPAIAGTSNQQSSNLILNKNNNTQQQQRLAPRQKVLGPNGNQTKYLNKMQSNIQKPSIYVKQIPEKPSHPQPRLLYPTHKGQIKTLPPVMNNYLPKVHGIKTIAPQHHVKGVPGQIQRTGSGLRTIPPQKSQKMLNTLNYIGKHAVQAQKVKQTGPHHRFNNKSVKQSGSTVYNSYIPQVHANKQLAFNQALTAEILETLSNKSATTSYPSKNYEILPSRYETQVFAEQKHLEQLKNEEKAKSGLDALSLICQAVLLDHNYNATLPPDSPTRSTPVSNNSSQMNGISSNSMLLYSPGANSKNKFPPERKRTVSSSNLLSPGTSSISNITSILPSSDNSMVNLQEDDALSDISDGSAGKRDTEGEETDTAPEAEAVTKDEPFDHYGDYITRCICGFLHDDGYMVECDQCKVWQHVQCVIKNKQIPEEFLCEKCNPMKPVDPHKAKLIQQQWLKERQILPDIKSFRKVSKGKDTLKHKEIPTDSDSSDTEHPRHNNNTSVKGRTTSAGRKKSEKHVGRQKKETKEPNAQRKTFKKRERKLVRRKSKLQAKNSEEENHDTFVTSQLPQLRQWIENYEEAVTNHYSPELRARISNIRVNGAHSTDSTTPFDPTVNKCRVHTQPLTDFKYLVAISNIPSDTPVIELRGKYMLSTQHRNSGGNLTTRQHAQRPGPFLFFYRLQKDNTEVCVDTRTYGNDARFIRRSCKPNAELRHCIEKGVLHLYIVTLTSVDKNVELTIKHESHDLAAVTTTQIACYCGNPEECKINKTTVKKNGESNAEIHRKRRGRRTTSTSLATSEPDTPSVKVKDIKDIKEDPILPPPQTPLLSPPIKPKSEPMEVDNKNDVKKEEVPESPKEKLTETKEEPVDVKEEERPVTPIESKESANLDLSESEDKEVKEEKEESGLKKSFPTRRSSQHKVEKDKDAEIPKEKGKGKKPSREDRKLEAILRAIEQMEKADQRKQEHKQTKHVQRRESEPSPHSKVDEKPTEPKQKRKRRKGRARTASTHSSRRDRLNSGDYFTSGDENILSPNEGMRPRKTNNSSMDDSGSGKHEGLLLALSSNDNSMKREKSPVKENDSNSNSAHSSPETPLSLACSLVQAAVEPLESGFKFPKTKKVLMNEWLNKTPENVSTTPSPLSPHINSETDSNVGFYTPTKNVPNTGNSMLNETGQRGSAKKRWLRQAISEDKCDSPQESPPLSDTVAPPKKRRLIRESISNDNTPPSTPTNLGPTINRLVQQEGCVEIVYSTTECDDNATETLESDAVLKERAVEMKQEFCKLVAPPTKISDVIQRPDNLPFGCVMDPRLRNHHQLFSNSEHLVGTVEKTLSIFGFEERKPEIITPAKRKLSITEYRQRKKLNNNESNEKNEESSVLDDCGNEENSSSESFKLQSARPRSNSTSSSSSASSTDDEQVVASELPSKAPAFNSEPTELERQREMQTLRLKKAFGLSIDAEIRKPALDVETMLNTDLTTLPAVAESPERPLSITCEPPDVASDSPPHVENIPSQPSTPLLSPVEDDIEDASEPPIQKLEDSEDLPTNPEEVSQEESEIFDSEAVEEVTKREELEISVTEEEQLAVDEEDEKSEQHEEKEEIKPNMFYTPDEEEEVEEEEDADKSYTDVASVNYVPPFNNPIYPSINYTSVIDEEGRYEGRNPSPPPSHLESVESET